MATHGDIGLSQPASSTITLKLDSVTLDANSTIVHREVMVVGSPETTNALTAVLNTAPASTAWGMVVRVADPSTTVQVSSLAGAVVMRSSAASALVSVYQSTAADLNVTVANLSTGPNLSRVTDRDQSTNVAAVLNAVPASTAYGLTVRVPAPITDSTNNAFRVNVVAGSVAGDTSVTVNGNTSSNSSAYLPVRLTNGTAFLGVSLDYQQDSTMTSTAVTGPTLMLRTGAPAPASTDTWEMAYGSTVGVQYVAVAPDSGVSVMDSTNTAVRVNVVAGAAGGSTIVTVSTGSVRVHQSTAADLNVTVAGYSTTVNVSSLAGAVITRSSAANMLATVYQSTAADFQATVTPASTGWQVLSRVTTSSGGGIEGSTATPAQGVLGLHVRQALSSLQSTSVVLTSSNSTVILSLISSVAGMRHKVYAYAVFASTSGAPSTLVFLSNSTTPRWAVGLSSGFSGANLAVSPPAFLFESVSQANMGVVIESASTAITARVSVSWFTEP